MAIPQIVFYRNSINTITTVALKDNNQALLTNANATAYLSITNFYTAGSVFAQTAMTYSSPGVWTIDVPAVNFVAGTTLTFTINVYSQAGNSGPVLLTVDAVAIDNG